IIAVFKNSKKAACFPSPVGIYLLRQDEASRQVGVRNACLTAQQAFSGKRIANALAGLSAFCFPVVIMKDIDSSEYSRPSLSSRLRNCPGQPSLARTPRRVQMRLNDLFQKRSFLSVTHVALAIQLGSAKRVSG